MKFSVTRVLLLTWLLAEAFMRVSVAQASCLSSYEGQGNWRQDCALAGILLNQPKYIPQYVEHEYTYTVRNQYGGISPRDGYAWKSDDPNDYRVERAPEGTPSQKYLHLVWAKDGKLLPEDGYRWASNGEATDYRVERVPDGTPSKKHPHLVWSGDGSLRPADGYRWASNVAGTRVERVPDGTPSKKHPSLVWNGNGRLRPADGYRWVLNPPVPGDYRVERGFNSPSVMAKRHLATSVFFPTASAHLSLSDLLPATAQLVAALNSVGRSFHPVKDAAFRNCSRHFRLVGHKLKHNGLPVGEEWLAPGLRANDIINKIRENERGHWQRVDEEQVQVLANKGVVVVGAAKGWPHGHVAIAFPTPPHFDPSKYPGRGPFVRDGNEHARNLHLSTNPWDATRASLAFNYRSSQPTWYRWVPSDQG